MDEMNAFDKQLAGVVLQRVGPSRPVNDAAIFTAITDTRSPRLAFQSMFSATRLVVAGALVALFGGFLLAGVLTQPSKELAPAAVSPAPTTSEDLLSTLDTEEVAPGVFRVLSDGYRGLHEKVGYVAVTTEGDVWVLKYGGQGAVVRLERVNEPGVAYQSDDGTGEPVFMARLVTGHDGTIGYAQGPHQVPVVLDGREWVTNRGSAYDDCARLFGNVAADGTCFDHEAYASPRILQQDGGRNQQAFGRNSLFGYDVRLGQLASARGIVWQDAFRPGLGTQANRFQGLARYDGESWTSIPYTEEPARPISGPISVTPDGVVWVPSYIDGEGLTLVSWDGERWHSYGPVAVPRSSAEAHINQDGTTTFGVMASFDGTSLKRLSLPDAVVEGMGPVTFAPDGTAWAVKGSGLYVITPEAFAAAESGRSASQWERSRDGGSPSPIGPGSPR